MINVDQPPPAGPSTALADTAAAPGHLVRHRGQPISADEIDAAVALLPIPGDRTARYGPPRLTAEWLGKFRSAHTVAAYGRDLAAWLTWCQSQDLNPLTARRADADAFVRHLTTGTGQAPAASTLARKLSVISSWYRYLASNQAIEHNPIAAVDRPEFNRDQSTTVGLSLVEYRAFMATVRAARSPQAPRNRALVAVLAELGPRVGELIAADIADLHYREGHRAITIHGKGGRDRTLPLPAGAGRDLDAYLAQRSEREGVPVDRLAGALFVTGTRQRLTQPQVYELVRRIAKAAGIPSWPDISPHSIRHAAATLALDDGASLRDVQDLLGHADPRTTRRYDRNRGALARSPAYRLDRLAAAAPAMPDVE